MGPLCPNCTVSSPQVNVGGSLVWLKVHFSMLSWLLRVLLGEGCFFKAFGLRYPFVCWFVGFENMFGSWPFGVLIWFKEVFLFSSWGCDKTLTKSNLGRKAFFSWHLQLVVDHCRKSGQDLKQRLQAEPWKKAAHRSNLASFRIQPRAQVP